MLHSRPARSHARPSKSGGKARPPKPGSHSPRIASLPAESPRPREPIRDFDVGIDFGTTAHKVAYTSYERDSNTSIQSWEDIKYVRWGGHGARDGGRDSVPNYIAYKSCDEEDTLFGLDAERMLGESTFHERSRYMVARAKPFDDPLGQGREWKDPLPETFAFLKREGIIEDDYDVIRDQFTFILKHTKKYLSNLDRNRQLTAESHVTFCLTVPSIWSSGIRQNLKRALASASRLAEFGNTTTILQPSAIETDGNPITTSVPELSNVLFLTEMDAAVTFNIASVLHRNKIEPGMTLLGLNVGGGSMDVAIFRVLRLWPLRLQAEGKTRGGNYGANNLNDLIRKVALRKTNHALYLERPEVNITLDRLVEREVVNFFEYPVKRDLDFETKSQHSFEFLGLLKDEANGISKHNRLHISKEEFLSEVFDPAYEKIAGAVRETIEQATVRPTYILPFGGGMDQPYIHPYLQEKVLNPINASGGIQTSFLDGKSGSMAVACGAIYARTHPAEIPNRELQSNFGIMYTARAAPGLPGYETLKRQNVLKDIYDGEPIVPDVIKWFGTKGTDCGNNTVLYRFEHAHQFCDYYEAWEAIEILVFSDEDEVFDYYQDSHPRNRGHKKERVMSANFRPLLEPYIRSRALKGTPRAFSREQLGIVEDDNAHQDPSRKLPKRRRTRDKIEVMAYTVPMVTVIETHGIELAYKTFFTPEGAREVLFDECRVDLSSHIRTDVIQQTQTEGEHLN